MSSSRRNFLLSGAAVTAAAQIPEPHPAPIPRVRFQNREITRLLIGSNPLYGYSHFNSTLDRCMLEWMTQDRRIETLRRAEAAGINTWQVHYNEPTIEDWKRYRGEGGRMQVLLLADFELMKNWALIKKVAALEPVGIAHHGGRTDERFRAGQMNIVRDFTKAVKDAGVPAGVSTHNPAVVRHIEENGWDIQYYMTCLYRVTRTPEETRKEFGEAPLGETFMERDPERMTAMIRATNKTCFAFKILAAGRNTGSPAQVEGAFRYAFDHIKPQDAVIVGMFPKFKDEARENAAIAARVLQRT